jgi:hypothetical protein
MKQTPVKIELAEDGTLTIDVPTLDSDQVVEISSGANGLEAYIRSMTKAERHQAWRRARAKQPVDSTESKTARAILAGGNPAK